MQRRIIMNYYYEAFKNYFNTRFDKDCPYTEALIKSGFQQSRRSGYTKDALAQGIPVDFSIASPSQGWHFKNYLENVDPTKARILSISCGELIYWWAEISHALNPAELKDLAEKIKPLGRRKANGLIRQTCLPKVLEIVEAAYTAA